MAVFFLAWVASQMGHKSTNPKVARIPLSNPVLGQLYGTGR